MSWSNSDSDDDYHNDKEREDTFIEHLLYMLDDFLITL